MTQAGAGPDETPAEPSMEDILASIRRILNDESETAAPPAAGAADPPADDVFQLEHSMIVEEPAEPETPPPAEAPQPPEFELGPEPEEPLLAPAAAAAASASLGALVRVVAHRQTQVYRDGPTLEDMVRDELRPILKAWLDENLAPLVERAVRAEIERVTRNAT